MLDEEMDHIIRDAADKHHPAYDDKAWEKMEMMLDKHLPQKSDRRKFVFFLLFFLLLGGGALFTILQLNRNKASENKKIAAERIDKQPDGNSEVKNNITVKDNTENSGNGDTGKETTTTLLNGDNNILQQNDKNTGSTEGFRKTRKNVTSGKGKSRISIVAVVPEEELTGDRKGIPTAKRSVKKNNNGKKNIVITAAVPENADNVNIVNTEVNVNNKINSEEEQENAEILKEKEIVQTVDEKKDKDLIKPDDKPTSVPDKKKSKNVFGNNFGITVSAGPDLSFVSLNNLGKATLAYGAGLSYSFAKRFTVRTGFYLSKKIYTASPDQYHTPGGNYPYLDIVGATCKVYEIPVSLSYNFGQKKNHSWFGSAGLSSFLMKTEDYDYQYKLPSGQTYNYAWNVKNENKHYFSVLTLSGGYQYHFSKRVSLQAEPYVKLPLSGIGAGKIKLNSSGILLTLTIKPFAKK